MDDVTKRLEKSGLKPGPVQGGAMVDRIRAVSDQVDRVVDPSIERNEKARSNRF